MAQELGETNYVCASEDRDGPGHRGWWGSRQSAHGPRHRREQGEPTSLGETRLSQAGAGSTVTVTDILGDEVFRGKMMAMGIVPGAAVSVVQGGARRPLLVALPGSRFLLDWKSSEMITVRGLRLERTEGRM